MKSVLGVLVLMVMAMGCKMDHPTRPATPTVHTLVVPAPVEQQQVAVVPKPVAEVLHGMWCSGLQSSSIHAVVCTPVEEECMAAYTEATRFADNSGVVNTPCQHFDQVFCFEDRPRYGQQHTSCSATMAFCAAYRALSRSIGGAVTACEAESDPSRVRLNSQR